MHGVQHISRAHGVEAKLLGCPLFRQNARKREKTWEAAAIFKTGESIHQVHIYINIYIYIFIMYI